jgi:MFS family permease
MEKRSGPYDILKNVNFRHLALGRFSLNLALQLQTVVVGWQVYEIKKDPLYLGLIGLTEAVPAISLALFGGHVVDRGQPIKIYRAMLQLALLSSLALLLVAGGIVSATPDTKLSVIFGVIFLSGIIRAFAWPSVFAVTPQIIDREWYAVAQTWLSTMFQTSSIAGPAIGGMIYAWSGPRSAYVVMSVLIAASIGSAYRIRVPRLERAPRSESEPFVQSLVSGVRFVFSNQVILGALSLDMFAVLFGGATALLPIFTAEILKSGPESLGILRAAPAVGALIMSFIMIHRPLGRAAGSLLLWAVSGYGVCMIVFGLSRTLWLSVVALALSGAFDAVSVVIRHTILQLWTPDEMRGRVSAVNMIFIGSSNEIGEFESGVMARLMGTVRSVVFGGCMTLVVVVAAAILAPKLRKIEFDQPISKKG